MRTPIRYKYKGLQNGEFELFHDAKEGLSIKWLFNGESYPINNKDARVYLSPVSDTSERFFSKKGQVDFFINQRGLHCGRMSPRDLIRCFNCSRRYSTDFILPLNKVEQLKCWPNLQKMGFERRGIGAVLFQPSAYLPDWMTTGAIISHVSANTFKLSFTRIGSTNGENVEYLLNAKRVFNQVKKILKNSCVANV